MAEQEITNGQDAVSFLSGCDYRGPLDDEVDMVMKGGITSGVVYPLAVCELARTKRFRSLGGSSAGGIAAAFAAVAELGRSKGGFQKLARLPEDLGDNLLHIFQPSPQTAPLFKILVAGLDQKRFRMVGAVIAGAKKFVLLALGTALLFAFWAVLAVSGPPHSGHQWLHLLRALPFAAVPALVLALVGAAVGLVLTGRTHLEANGYGLCRGSNGPGWKTTPGPPEEVEPFADWMHAKLNDIAGKDRGSVVTFGDLWGPGGSHDPAIRLEMMSTNVTLCRPTRLPFEGNLYSFCRVELAEYFPPPIIEHLVQHARPSHSGPWLCPEHEEELLHFPEPGQLPVLIAVRMTLSFPGLISAVPLWFIDRGATVQSPVKCWFSDGGISSNFPIHFFDALWPGRPTFGISLGPFPPGHDEPVYMRKKSATALPRPRSTDTAIGFFSAMLDTLQNWSDEGQSMLPGYRDRIVEVRLTDDEGGINLNMPRQRIMALAYRGYLAAKELRGFDFDYHRSVRYLTAMAELDKAVANMRSKYDGSLPGGGLGYRALIPQITFRGHGPHWLADAVARTDQLLDFAGRPPGQPGPPDQQRSPDFAKDEPHPVPDLRIVAHF